MPIRPRHGPCTGGGCEGGGVIGGRVVGLETRSPMLLLDARMSASEWSAKIPWHAHMLQSTQRATKGFSMAGPRESVGISVRTSLCPDGWPDVGSWGFHCWVMHEVPL